MSSNFDQLSMQESPSSPNATKLSIENIPPQKNQSKKKKKKKSKNQTSSSTPDNDILSPTSTTMSSEQDDVNINSSTVQDQSNQPFNSDSKSSPSTTKSDVTNQREQSLRHALKKAQEENNLLTSDLKAALARASDAEEAETKVNKGLLSARSVILQREKLISELNSNLSNIRSEHAMLVEEKQKLDKKLVVLQNISEKFHEARESCEQRDRKIDDYNIKMASLKSSFEEQVEVVDTLKDKLSLTETQLNQLTETKSELEKKIEAMEVMKQQLIDTQKHLEQVSTEKKVLEKQVETMAMLKQQLSHTERDLESALQNKEFLEIKGKRARVQVATVSVLGTVALTTALRVLGAVRRND